ncbi:hypothetical protein EHQ52_02520 [Leptospira koniambonensis]|uniref:Uncharacterized protein n=1 Tax=Leptospira koniambonensis TaxID=2484950 RepID=A0A4R9JBL6_9LEPT|nr:hypothetical protein [Leptospira koniambonensis]TGL36770.1 hypothetical protein EHQ52_02520 [Leptospira koniambonensis]
MPRLNIFILALVAFFLTAPNDYEETAYQNYLLYKRNHSSNFRLPSQKSKLRFSSNHFAQFDQNEDYHQKDKNKKDPSSLGDLKRTFSICLIVYSRTYLRSFELETYLFARPPPILS